MRKRISLTRRQALQRVRRVRTDSAIGIAPRFIRPAFAQRRLAAGMTGGPTGFPGAERFQYNEEHVRRAGDRGHQEAQGRGQGAGKIVMLLTDGAIGQINKPFPAGAPSVHGGLEARDRRRRSRSSARRRATSGPRCCRTSPPARAPTTSTPSPGTASATWSRPTAPTTSPSSSTKYKPDWGDPERGAPSPQIEELLYKYNGKYYSVSLDGDFQTWVYNKAMYDDPKHQEAFAGQDTAMRWRRRATWEESDHISEFFTGSYRA